MGTAGYMSPEQVRGEKVDARTDLFSFGLVLYEMATGQRAFGGETAAVVRDAILNQTPVPLREVNSALPPKLEQIINRAIEKDRELRYQSAAEMRADLQSVASGPGSRQRKSRRAPSMEVAGRCGNRCVAMLPGRLFVLALASPSKLTDQDTIVLADFDNKTGRRSLRRHAETGALGPA